MTSVSRYVDNEWVDIPTEVVATSDSITTFQATSPGFSTFAVGTKPPSFTIEEVTIDGSAIDEQTVTIRPGDSTPVSFTRTFDATGEYAVDFGDQAAGTVVVEAESDEPSADDGSTDDGSVDDDEPDTDDDGPGFGVVTALVAIAGTLLVMARRRQT